MADDEGRPLSQEELQRASQLLDDDEEEEVLPFAGFTTAGGRRIQSPLPASQERARELLEEVVAELPDATESAAAEAATTAKEKVEEKGDREVGFVRASSGREWREKKTATAVVVAAEEVPTQKDESAPSLQEWQSLPQSAGTAVAATDDEDEDEQPQAKKPRRDEEEHDAKKL